MEWFSFTLSRAQVSSGDVDGVIQHFNREKDVLNRDVQMFMGLWTTGLNGDVATFYAAVGSRANAYGFLELYDARACRQPSLDGLKFIAGDARIMNLIPPLLR